MILALAGLIWYVFFYRPPSCTDGLQNQDEEAVDCGGACAALCVVPKISIVWARSVEVAPGVFHGVALVRNPLTDAGGENMTYTMRLLDAEGILIAETMGTLSLAPGEVAPIFEPNIQAGFRVPARTFVSVDAGFWKRMEHTVDPIRIGSPALDQEALRLSATLENTTALPVGRVTATALLYDEEDILVAASQTILDGIAPRASREVIFTWQQPFTKPVVRIDIVPRISR